VLLIENSNQLLELIICYFEYHILNLCSDRINMVVLTHFQCIVYIFEYMCLSCA
jgi:hypothetical protein